MNRDKSQVGNKELLRDKAGEMVEDLGEKVSNAGAPKIGQKIHDLGDKIEKTHKKPDHPQDV